MRRIASMGMGMLALAGCGGSSSLQSRNIWTEPGAITSTAYLAGADGYLHAVIVDGVPQNTSNAGVTP